MNDISAYLNRINYRGSTQPTLETLRGIHRAHLLTVPFENLDIHLNRHIVLDEAALFEKIVVNGQGDGTTGGSDSGRADSRSTGATGGFGQAAGQFRKTQSRQPDHRNRVDDGRGFCNSNNRKPKEKMK